MKVKIYYTRKWSLSPPEYDPLLGCPYRIHFSDLIYTTPYDTLGSPYTSRFGLNGISKKNIDWTKWPRGKSYIKVN